MLKTLQYVNIDTEIVKGRNRRQLRVSEKVVYALPS